MLKSLLKSHGAVVAIGLFIGACGAAGAWWGRGLMVRSIISASDDWMLSNRGPAFGARTVEPEIVLVDYGQPSALRLKTKPTPETDEQLYRALLEAGASVVMDTRTLAAGTPEMFVEEVQPFLDAMAANANAGGKLARDVTVSPAVDASTLSPYLPMIQHNSINLRTPTAPMLHSRVYPLMQHDYFALKESAALWIARRHRGAMEPSLQEFAQQLKDSGIQQQWESQVPGIVQLLPPSGSGTDDELPHAPSSAEYSYQHPCHAIPWMPFASSYPAVAPVGFWIDYSVDTRQYPRLEYGDVVARDFDAGVVAGKIVLIGLTLDFVPSGERFQIPQRLEQASESEVLAAAVQTVLDGRSLHKLPTWAMFTSILLGAVLAALAASHRTIWLALLLVAGVFLLYFAGAIWAYRECWFADIVWTPSVFLVSAIATGCFRFVREVRSRRRITDMFGRYVPRAVVEELIRRPELQQMMFDGVKRIVTVMFADIRGFTSYSETRPPEDVLLELNRMLKVMVDCTFEEQGTVDKFIGDAILVLFNAPTEQQQHCLQAVRTAWKIQSRLAATGANPLGVGIGIHTGQAVVGHVGTPQRMEYTAVGSTVNLASRLCDQARAGDIIVTKDVAEACEEEFEFEPLPAILVKGLSQQIAIARVLGSKSADTPEFQHDQTGQT